MLKTITATVIYSEYHEPFRNVEVLLTNNATFPLTGVAIIRGMHVEVKQIKEHYSIWRITDEEYFEIEDLEINGIVDVDDEEYYNDYVVESKCIYRRYGVKEEYWRIKSREI